jgi:hypothetical protein
VSEYSFTDSHAERRMRDAERSGDRFPDYPQAAPGPPPKRETGTLYVSPHPDVVPSLRDAVAMSKLAKAGSAQGPPDTPVPSLRDMRTAAEGKPE